LKFLGKIAEVPPIFTPTAFVEEMAELRKSGNDKVVLDFQAELILLWLPFCIAPGGKNLYCILLIMAYFVRMNFKSVLDQYTKNGLKCKSRQLLNVLMPCRELLILVEKKSNWKRFY
jgi:hypothetical protein